MKINNHEVTIITTCPICGRLNQIEANDDDYWDWKDGKLVQNAFPYLSADEREMLISGICPTCWAKTFDEIDAHDDDDDFDWGAMNYDALDCDEDWYSEDPLIANEDKEIAPLSY